MNTNLKLLLVIVSMSFSPVTQSDAIGSGELQYVGSASSKQARGRQVYVFASAITVGQGFAEKNGRPACPLQVSVLSRDFKVLQ